MQYARTTTTHNCTRESGGGIFMLFWVDEPSNPSWRSLSHQLHAFLPLLLFLLLLFLLRLVLLFLFLLLSFLVIGGRIEIA